MRLRSQRCVEVMVGEGGGGQGQRAVGAEEGVKKWVGAGNREKGKEIEEQESCDMVMMR